MEDPAAAPELCEQLLVQLLGSELAAVAGLDPPELQAVSPKELMTAAMTIDGVRELILCVTMVAPGVRSSRSACSHYRSVLRPLDLSPIN